VSIEDPAAAELFAVTPLVKADFFVVSRPQRNSRPRPSISSLPQSQALRDCLQSSLQFELEIGSRLRTRRRPSRKHTAEWNTDVGLINTSMFLITLEEIRSLD
jgi:hypothetical protein